MKTLIKRVLCIIAGFVIGAIIFMNLPTIKAAIGDRFTIDGFKIDANGNATFDNDVTISEDVAITGYATIGKYATVTGTTTINQVLVLASKSYTPASASTGTIYMDSCYVVKVCTSVTGTTRYWQSVGAQ